MKNSFSLSSLQGASGGVTTVGANGSPVRIPVPPERPYHSLTKKRFESINFLLEYQHIFSVIYFIIIYRFVFSEKIQIENFGDDLGVRLTVIKVLILLVHQQPLQPKMIFGQLFNIIIIILWITNLLMKHAR